MVLGVILLCFAKEFKTFIVYQPIFKGTESLTHGHLYDCRKIVAIHLDNIATLKVRMLLYNFLQIPSTDTKNTLACLRNLYARSNRRQKNHQTLPYAVVYGIFSLQQRTWLYRLLGLYLNGKYDTCWKNDDMNYFLLGVIIHSCSSLFIAIEVVAWMSSQNPQLYSFIDGLVKR